MLSALLLVVLQVELAFRGYKTWLHCLVELSLHVSGLETETERDFDVVKHVCVKLNESISLLERIKIDRNMDQSWVASTHGNISPALRVSQPTR